MKNRKDIYTIGVDPERETSSYENWGKVTFMSDNLIHIELPKEALKEPIPLYIHDENTNQYLVKHDGQVSWLDVDAADYLFEESDRTFTLNEIESLDDRYIQFMKSVD